MKARETGTQRWRWAPETNNLKPKAQLGQLTGCVIFGNLLVLFILSSLAPV